ncbi:MAG: D-alanyl-D-alanine carboxypeptidase/D-alanyl-D-alanine endopeptidase [Candidatus Sumerlaeaceae bacterium]
MFNIRFYHSAIIAFSLAVFVSAGNSAAQAVAEKVKAALDPIFDAPAWRNSRWGIAVFDLQTSELLYERDIAKSFMPASNMKLYTTAAALEQLGSDFSYATRIHATGTTTSKGVLRGNLVVVGSGDPSVSGRYIEDKPTTAILREWAQAVKSAGIRRVDGAVIGDDDVFDDESRTGSWQLDYYQEWYAAENSGLTINDNCWDVVIKPGRKPGDPAIIETPLPSKYVRFINRVTTSGPKRRGSGVASGAESSTATASAADELSTSTADTTASEESSDPPIEIVRELDRNDITLSGTIAVDHEPFKEWGSVHNGTLFTAALFAEELTRQGIRVAEGAKDIDDLDVLRATKLKADRGILVHTHVSPPLSKIIATINKPSQNFYADQLLKTLGAQTYGQGNYDSGRRAVRDFLTTAGIQQTGSLRMSDGSGLSRQNLVEPQMTLALLQFMARSRYAADFEASLPIMGVDGTLKSRLRRTAAHRNVYAKTGTINSVRSLSGYLTTAGGHKLAFCMMANNFSVPTRAATEAQDKALLKLIALDDVTSALASDNTSTSGAH